MKHSVTYSYIFLAFTMVFFEASNIAIAQKVREHQYEERKTEQVSVHREYGYEGLRNILQTKNWQRAYDYSWEWIVQVGDQNNDNMLDYHENDNFPCNDLRQQIDLWRNYFGSSNGYKDILFPRFNNRAVSCGIYTR